MAYHDHEGVAFRDDKKPRLQADMGHANLIMLRNHGLLTCGKTIGDAFLSMYTFENTCQIEIAAQSGGSELTHVNPNIIDGVGQAMKMQSGGLVGKYVGPSLIRKLELQAVDRPVALRATQLPSAERNACSATRSKSRPKHRGSEPSSKWRALTRRWMGPQIFWLR